MPKLHWEDLNPGDVFWGATESADREEMLDYARRNDPLPFHLDEEAAKASQFGGLIASGSYVITLWYRTSVPVLADIELLGGLEWLVKLKAPVRPDDQVRLRIEMIDKAPSRKPGRGYITIMNELFNQDDELVFTCEAKLMVGTRQSS